MSNKWNNEKKFLTLNADYQNEVLIFKAGKEKAEVHIVENDIQKVVYSHDGEETIVDQKERHHVVVGENNWQRDVYHYLKPGGPAPFMRLGITKHQGQGTWSSLPHDFELNTEADFEEVFFYLLKGEPKRAIQVGKGVWFDNSPVDSAWFVYDRTFGTVPMGYHPVVGEPGVEVSYIWVYLAKKKEWEKI